MAERLKLKKGDTLSAVLTVTRSGSPVNLTGVTMTSEVRRTDGALQDTLTVTPISLVNGVIRVRSETADWPLGFLDWDVQFVENGDTWSIPTQSINLQKDVTGAGQ